MQTLFDRCVRRSVDGRELWIRCRLGLWSVESHDREIVEREAWKYWSQYYKEGAYDSLLCPEHIKDAMDYIADMVAGAAKYPRQCHARILQACSAVKRGHPAPFVQGACVLQGEHHE